MQNGILDPLLRVLVTLQPSSINLLTDAARKLSGPKGPEWEEIIAKTLRKEPADSVPPTPEMLLELVGTVQQAATTAKFVAKKKFKLKKDGGICSYIGDNFSIFFLTGNGRIEEPVGVSELRYDRLRKSSVDGPIIVELGGVRKVMTGLTHMYSLMETQHNGPKSEAGPLLTNGGWNIFYVPQAVEKLEGNRYSYGNTAGKTVTEEVSNPDYLFQMNSQWYVLRTVYVRWYDGGWDVDAGSVENLGTWGGGRQVFSRNSVLKSSEPVSAAS